MKRIAAKDPDAMRQMGLKHYNHEEDYESAFEYWTQAAELWAISMHIIIVYFVLKGRGGVICWGRRNGDTYSVLRRLLYFGGGHAIARHYLALREKWCDRFDRAVKHFIIAANLGYDGSLKELKGCYAEGKASKDDFALALRAHQAAVDEQKVHRGKQK